MEQELRDPGEEASDRGSNQGNGPTFTNPVQECGDADLIGDLNTVTGRSRGRGVTKGTTVGFEVSEFTVDDGDDILDIVEGAVSRRIGLAVLDKCLEYAGYDRGTPIYKLAKGQILKWLVINTASGNNDFQKVIQVKGNREIATKHFQRAMHAYNVDELRRVGVALLPEQKSLVDRSAATRQYLAQINGISNLAHAWLGIDSIWKLPGISPRAAAMGKKYAKHRIAEAKRSGKESSGVNANDMFALDESL